MILDVKAPGRSIALDAPDLSDMDQTTLDGIAAAVIPAANLLPLKWVMGHCSTGGPDVRTVLLVAADDIDLALFAARIKHSSLPDGYRHIVPTLINASKGHGTTSAAHQRREAAILLSQLAILVGAERIKRELDLAAERAEAGLSEPAHILP